jgi:hypothetical protein
MAVTRFEARKQLVLEEADAIGTSYLRTRLLRDPEGTAIADLLCQYVDSRLQFAYAGDNPERINVARQEGERLQIEFWTRAVNYASKNANPFLPGLLLQSLNQVIDLESDSWMAFHNHVPEGVIYVDIFLTLLVSVVLGYSFGLAGRRHAFSMCILAVAMTVVLGVIIDIDRPRRGFIRVSQQPMIDLQHQLRMSINFTTQPESSADIPTR